MGTLSLQVGSNVIAVSPAELHRQMRSKSDKQYSERIRTQISGCVAAGLLVMLPVAAGAQQIENCGSLLLNGSQPFDYTNPADHPRLEVVHYHHFTPEIEQLKGHNNCGNNRCRLSGDIDFTLRHYPNHHRALVAMMNYHFRGYDELDRPMPYTPNCYFDRALRFRPDDPVVRMIYGLYLHKTDRSSDALAQYRQAVSLAPESSEAHYNLGLMYVDLKMYALAREHAHRAYDLGYPLPGLRSKLERAGEWAEPSASNQNE